MVHFPTKPILEMLTCMMVCLCAIPVQALHTDLRVHNTLPVKRTHKTVDQVITYFVPSLYQHAEQMRCITKAVFPDALLQATRTCLIRNTSEVSTRDSMIVMC
jgi:hypothetical protein